MAKYTLKIKNGTSNEPVIFAYIYKDEEYICCKLLAPIKDYINEPKKYKTIAEEWFDEAIKILRDVENFNEYILKEVEL